MTTYKHLTISISIGKQFSNSIFTESKWRDKVFQKTKRSRKKMLPAPKL